MPDPDFTDLPRDVTAYTPDQKERVVRYFAGLGLPDLRRRQDINLQQQRAAYDQKNARASANLQANYDLLTEAVDRSEFGDLKSLRPKHRRPRSR